MVSDKMRLVKTLPLISILLLSPLLFQCTPVANMTWNGEDYLMSGDYYKAIDEYTHAINLNPGDAMAYLGRATAFEELGHFDKALGDYNSAVAILPHDSGVYVDRGMLYEIMGNEPAAIEDYTRAIQFDPTNSNAYFHCGNAYMHTGDTKAAFDRYAAAARLGHVDSQNILKSRGMSW